MSLEIIGYTLLVESAIAVTYTVVWIAFGIDKGPGGRLFPIFPWK